MIAIDIETIPNLEMLDKLPEPNVAYGNLKDEEKRAEKYKQAKQDQRNKMALNPLFGKIVCIGMVGDGLRKCITGKEEDIIKEFFEEKAGEKIVTWNGNNFDIPFIFKRACIYGIVGLNALDSWTNRYTKDIHIDLMLKFCGWGKYEKLDTVADVYLGKKKIDFDVTKIPDMLKTDEGTEELKEYCLQDCKLVYELTKKFGY